MKINFLATFSLVGLALSGPARRDCGQEKCYDAVNECGMTYGGCWTACANGVTDLPTFTAPLCSSDTGSAISTAIKNPTETASATQLADTNTSQSLITPPPSPYPTKAPHLICGDSTQMYGGCYDVCTSAPPYTSPPCSLSSSTTTVILGTTDSVFGTTVSGYATTIPTPESGAAYTKDRPVDSVSLAADDNKALVMAEMPSNSATASPSASAPAPDAGEFRIANVPVESSELVEAPQSLRGAAIAKLLADKVRKPKTENKPCWDSPSCKEVQLGIPSFLPSAEISTETTASPTAEPSAESTPEPSADIPAEFTEETPAEAPTETPAETIAEATAEAPAEQSAEEPVDSPAELSIS